MMLKRIFSFAALLAFVASLATASRAQSVDRAALEGEIRALLAEMKSTEQQFLEPSAKDKKKNAEFLTLPDTGLIRLLPRETFDYGTRRLTIEGGGSYYSFSRLTHEYGYGSDISLEQGQFGVGFAGADFGFLTTVGKVAIENVTLEHPAARFLAEFVTPSLLADARQQQNRTGNGFDANGFTYKSRLPMKPKTTYLLRSINYRSSDLIVAFRVASQDTDGSVDIVWKILKKFPVPELTVP